MAGVILLNLVIYFGQQVQLSLDIKDSSRVTLPLRATARAGQCLTEVFGLLYTRGWAPYRSGFAYA